MQKLISFQSYKTPKKSKKRDSQKVKFKKKRERKRRHLELDIIQERLCIKSAKTQAKNMIILTLNLDLDLSEALTLEIFFKEIRLLLENLTQIS
jgi:hypothetical protein